MLQSLREEAEGKLQMLLSPRKNGLDSLFEEVRVLKVCLRDGQGYRADKFFVSGRLFVLSVWHARWSTWLFHISRCPRHVSRSARVVMYPDS